MSGLLPNAFHVARREYFVRVRGRAFVITTALLAVAVIGVIFIPTILAAAGVADPPEVAVVVEADDLRTDPKGEDFIRDDVRLGGAVEDIGATAGQHGERIGELADANREDVARATGNARKTSTSPRKRKR